MLDRRRETRSSSMWRNQHEDEPRAQSVAVDVADRMREENTGSSVRGTGSIVRYVAGSGGECTGTKR